MRGEQGPVELRYPGWLRVILGAVGDIVLFAALSLAIWTILPVMALGAAPIVISGGSMAPIIRAGDVMLLDDVAPPEGEFFAPGTIITYGATDAAGGTTGNLVTHRVAGVTDGMYVTRGDANATDDRRTVHPDQVLGAGRWLVPVIGLPAHWARSGAWHLVLATILGGVAAFAASRAGRRRIVVGAAEGVMDEEATPTPDEPNVPQPVLAFPLDDMSTNDVSEPADAATLEPSAAEHGATVATQATRRSMAGLDRLRRDREHADHEAASRDRRTGGSDGAAPLVSVIALALALLGTTIAPTYAAAAFSTTSGNPGNSFATAAATAGDITVGIDIVDDWTTGYCAEVLVSTTSSTPITWEIEVALDVPPLSGTPYSVWNATWSFDAPVLTASGAGHGWNDTVVAGSPAPWGFCANRPAPTQLVLPAHAGASIIQPPQNSTNSYPFTVSSSDTIHLYRPLATAVHVRASAVPGGNNHREIGIEVWAGGSLVASGVADVGNVGWTTVPVTLQLAPDAPSSIPAGAPIEVRLMPYRVDIMVDGPSSISFPN